MKRNRSLLLLLILALILGGLLWLLQDRQGDRGTPPSPRLPQPEAGRAGPEPSPPPAPSLPKAPPEIPPPSLPPAACRVAIIIDDLGYNGYEHHRFLEIPHPLTFAILPSLPYSARIAKEVLAQGREAMLHLPLEPHAYPRRNPGEGVILSSMGEAEARTILQQDLRSVPGARGVNNHMGSKLTEDPRMMRILLSEIKARNLYFVDSLTTKATTGPSLGRALGVKIGTRDVFLDNYQDRDYVEGQLRALVRVARHKGEAIAVGHPYPVTAAALKDFLPQLERQGIQLVSASQIVR